MSRKADVALAAFLFSTYQRANEEIDGLDPNVRRSNLRNNRVWSIVASLTNIADRAGAAFFQLTGYSVAQFQDAGLVAFNTTQSDIRLRTFKPLARQRARKGRR